MNDAIPMTKDHMCFTFIHAVEELTEVFSLAVVDVLLPGFSVLTAQQDQLSLLASHRAKMWDLYYHGPVKKKNTRF